MEIWGGDLTLFYLRFAVGFLAIKVLMEATVIAKISFVSDMILLKLATSTNLASTINSIQYKHSSASSSTILSLAIKSAVDLARQAAR